MAITLERLYQLAHERLEELAGQLRTDIVERGEIIDECKAEGKAEGKAVYEFYQLIESRNKLKIELAHALSDLEELDDFDRTVDRERRSFEIMKKVWDREEFD